MSGADFCISQARESFRKRVLYTDPDKWAKKYLTKEELEAAEKTIELIKQSGYDKTLKELEKDD